MTLTKHFIMNNLRNHVLLIGHLGQDVELKQFESGNHVARVTLATNESYKKDNEWVTETQWHRIVAWGKNAERMTAQLKKGNQVAIQGKLKYNTFEDKEGVKRTIAEITVNEFMLTSASKEASKEKTEPVA